MKTEKTAPLLLIPINSLLGMRFFIPSYQRGYRWTKTQVMDMLEDIWNFTPPVVQEGEKKETYCLQPVVVRNIDCEDSPLWEIIDGQQRLTTIKILLEYLHKLAPQWVSKPFELVYQTREKGNADYFEIMENSSLAAQSIDAFHIHAAYNTIRKWSEENKSILSKFHDKVINETSVIWYDVAAVEDVRDETKVVDIFTRLNIGKIALTNAELIKALFMQRKNFTENEIDAMQLQIATEWDSIEKKLQNDAFWYFIYNPPKMDSSSGQSTYDTRFEYIFDLKMKRKSDDDQYATFIRYSKVFKENVKKPADVLTMWREMKNYFLIFEEWYEDPDLYHLVGFLITSGVPLQKIYEQSSTDKDDFRNFLEKEIKRLFTKPLEKIDYNDRKNAKNVLLLFNVLTTNSEKSDTRFPFDRYKKGEWDIEHVRSLTDEEITPSTWRSWADHILAFFSGYDGDMKCSEELDRAVNNYLKPLGTEDDSHKKTAKGATKGHADGRATSVRLLRNEENACKKEICKTLLRLKEKEQEQLDFEKVKAVYNKVLHLYGEDTSMEDINNICNLALLDAATNRGYKNAMFPIKRKTIVKNEMRGAFVPVCTKNLFMKFYNKGDTDIMSWSAADADAYQAAMALCLKKYVLSERESHD